MPADVLLDMSVSEVGPGVVPVGGGRRVAAARSEIDVDPVGTKVSLLLISEMLIAGGTSLDVSAPIVRIRISSMDIARGTFPLLNYRTW